MDCCLPIWQTPDKLQDVKVITWVKRCNPNQMLIVSSIFQNSILPKNTQVEMCPLSWRRGSLFCRREYGERKGSSCRQTSHNLVHPTVLDFRIMQRIVLNFLPYSMETAVAKQCHIFFSLTLSSCLAEAPSGLLLHLLYGCFLFLPGPFLFPAHVTTSLGQDSGCFLHPSRVIVC